MCQNKHYNINKKAPVISFTHIDQVKHFLFRHDTKNKLGGIFQNTIITDGRDPKLACKNDN